MVTRVSTASSYSAILQNLLAAEDRQTNAENRVSSTKNGNDLKAFANQAETLTALKSVDARLTTYQAQNSQLTAKLNTQDQALNTVAGSATAVRQAIADALASGSAESLMQELQDQFTTAVSSLNSQFDGKYLFGGGQVATKPVTATQLTDLTSGPPIASFFQNDQFKAQAKLDDNTSVTTGQLASDLGLPMMQAFQALQAFNAGAGGPLTGKLTAAQQTFLTNALASWTQIGTDLTTATAQNGMVQKRVDDVSANLVTQKNNMTNMIGNITDADMAKAATDLSNAQLSVQATARVLQVLQSSSLINLLPAG